MSCLSLRPWQLTIAKDTVAKLTGSWKSVYFSFVFFEFPLVEEYQKCGQIIYGVMMTSRAFPPRGIVHIHDVNAKNQLSDWSNEDKRASRTVLCRRQLEQTTLNPSFSVFTSTRLLEVHLLPSSPISYNLNKMANRKILTIAQMFIFKSWWRFPGCYPCYWSVKLPLKIFVSNNFRVQQNNFLSHTRWFRLLTSSSERIILASDWMSGKSILSFRTAEGIRVPKNASNYALCEVIMLLINIIETSSGSLNR